MTVTDNGDLFGATPVRDSALFTLQNPKMLKMTLGNRSGSDVVYARQGSMVAYQGQAEFAGIEARNYRRGYPPRPLPPQVTPLMKVTGRGSVFLANQSQDVHVLTLAGDGFTVAGDNLLAFEQAIGRDRAVVRCTTPVPAMADAAAGADPGSGPTFGRSVALKGTGSFAVCTTGFPLVMDVRPGAFCFADADAVVGWSTNLHVQMQAAVRSAGVWRPRGNTGESWQMQFSGTGQVIVQPCELMPPYDALAGVGLLGQLSGALGGSGRR